MIFLKLKRWCEMLKKIEALEKELAELKAQLLVPAAKKLDWSKMPVDTLVEVSNDNDEWGVRYFAQEGYAFQDGATSLISNALTAWKHMRLAPADKQPWHVWFGGECQLPDGVLVDVVFRDESACVVNADALTWHHEMADSDIIAYKIVGLDDWWEY